MSASELISGAKEELFGIKRGLSAAQELLEQAFDQMKIDEMEKGLCEAKTKQKNG